MAFTSSSKRGPSLSLVTSSPLSSRQSTKLTPFPSEYMQRWTLSLLKRLDAMRRREAVKSSAASPDAEKTRWTNREMVWLRCR